MERKLAHGCRIEWQTEETEVHEVRLGGYHHKQLVWDIIRRCQGEKDSFVIVSGHERGSGKTTWGLHFIEGELYPEMYQYGLVGDSPTWDMEKWMVCFDPKEFRDKYLMDVPHWCVVQDDEAIKNLFRRSAMTGRQKADVEFLIVGRFLKKVTLACSTNVLRIDTAVLEDVATHWVHIARSWKGGALIKIRRRCPYYTEPSKKIYWDCMAHLRYQYTFPYEELKAVKAFKKSRFDDWRRKTEEPEPKPKRKKKELTTTFGSSDLESIVSKDVAALEGSHTQPEVYPVLYKK